MNILLNISKHFSYFFSAIAVFSIVRVSFSFINNNDDGHNNKELLVIVVDCIKYTFCRYFSPNLFYIHFYEGWLKSKRDWCHKQLIWIPINKPHGFPFQLILHESNSLLHSSMSFFWALLEGFFFDAPQLCLYALLDDLHAFRTGFLDDPFEIGEKKKVTRSKIKQVGRLFKYGDVLLGQELSDSQDAVSSCIVMAKRTRFVLPQPSSHLAHWNFVDLLIKRLALWRHCKRWRLTRRTWSVSLIFKQISYIW